MGTVTKHGRQFEFDDDTSPDVQERRIQKWMQENAADELKAAEPAPAAAEKKPVNPDDPDRPKTSYNPKLALAMSALAGPFMPMAMHPAVQKRLGDVNFLRTLAQGALPVADEATAGVRSVLPESWGGADYDTALGQERQGVKDYASEYGPLESGAIQMLGAAGTLPFGGAAVQGASKLPILGRGVTALGAAAKAHPWIASVLGGTATGAATGFASGEGGFEERLHDATGMGGIGALLGPAGYGAAQAFKGAGNWVKPDNAVANFLRKQIASERNIDPASKTFTKDAMTGMRKEMSERDKLLNTDPMVADLLPKTTEGVFQKSGQDVNNLAKNILDRQFNEKLDPMLAKGVGQHGRVGDAMDMAWGPEMFKKADADIIKTRKADADAMFAPSYVHNINNMGIDDAMERIGILDPKIIDQAKRWAEAERRGIGFVDRQGVQRNYNTQYLHDIKRSMDAVLGEERRANPKFNDMPYIKAKRDLNEAMKEANSGYKAAMERYGEHSDLESALKKGREEVFVPGSVDKTGGMDADAIKAYLKDPDISPEAKDLFLTGAARSARERFLNSDSKKLSHNAADFINVGKNMDTVEALLGDKLTALSSGPTLNSWKLFQKKMQTESRNYKNLIQTGLGNSRTAVRENMKKEIEGGDFNPGAVISAMVNPTAPSTWRESGRIVLDKLSRTDTKVNKVAELLGRKGKASAQPGQPARSSLDDIENLLKGYDVRQGVYDRAGGIAPYVLPYLYPGRKQ